MKGKWFCYLLLLACWDCSEAEEKYPVYRVDFDHPDTVMPADLFSKVEVIPLETNDKSRFSSGELGRKDDRYYILDRRQQLFFCFDTTGKFKYVLDNKPKNKEKKKHLSVRSILNPYSYYYQGKWYYYLTFRNIVYNKDVKGNQFIAYRWDFGKYNDDEETRLSFPPLPIQVLAEIQKAWMKANSAFALTNARQSDKYIYTLVERIAGDSILPEGLQFYHLLCYKPEKRCYYFNAFADGIPLSTELRLENQYILTMVSFAEKEKFLELDLLDEESRNILVQLKETDNPVILKWWFKK